MENVTIRVPRDAAKIIEKLEQAGYEAYAVGGCVRDSLLGREPGDWDITTAALPEQVEAVKNCYRIIYQSGLNLTKAVEKIKEEIPQCEERDEILRFIAASQHGILKGPKLD